MYPRISPPYCIPSRSLVPMCRPILAIDRAGILFYADNTIYFSLYSYPITSPLVLTSFPRNIGTLPHGPISPHFRTTTPCSSRISHCDYCISSILLGSAHDRFKYVPLRVSCVLSPCCLHVFLLFTCLFTLYVPTYAPVHSPLACVFICMRRRTIHDFL